MVSRRRYSPRSACGCTGPAHHRRGGDDGRGAQHRRRVQGRRASTARSTRRRGTARARSSACRSSRRRASSLESSSASTSCRRRCSPDDETRLKEFCFQCSALVATRAAQEAALAKQLAKQRKRGSKAAAPGAAPLVERNAKPEDDDDDDDDDDDEEEEDGGGVDASTAVGDVLHSLLQLCASEEHPSAAPRGGGALVPVPPRAQPRAHLGLGRRAHPARARDAAAVAPDHLLRSGGVGAGQPVALAGGARAGARGRRLEVAPPPRQVGRARAPTRSGRSAIWRSTRGSARRCWRRASRSRSRC